MRGVNLRRAKLLSLEVELHAKFHGVYWITLEGERRLATRNMTPGRAVYGEHLVRSGGVEYRLWNPFRSKLAAAVLNGLRNMPISEGGEVLYLGAATGTTSSHISDIVGAGGSVYCVE
ncbi:MAG: fibrillarin-like rRNA/tRNA 2'-O-methyltransferase, partial [Candidatus Bathyarchaeota archaeon]|nr:fibrillarin-like rRNA/tRNA 2'-O-methyltransferase [Candidatus Bathyarchaeota archaeon]